MQSSQTFTTSLYQSVSLGKKKSIPKSYQISPLSHFLPHPQSTFPIDSIPEPNSTEYDPSFYSTPFLLFLSTSIGELFLHSFIPLASFPSLSHLSSLFFASHLTNTSKLISDKPWLAYQGLGEVVELIITDIFSKEKKSFSIVIVNSEGKLFLLDIVFDSESLLPKSNNESCMTPIISSVLQVKLSTCISIPINVSQFILNPYGSSPAFLLSTSNNLIYLYDASFQLLHSIVIPNEPIHHVQFHFACIPTEKSVFKEKRKEKQVQTQFIEEEKELNHVFVLVSQYHTQFTLINTQGEIVNQDKKQSDMLKQWNITPYPTTVLFFLPTLYLDDSKTLSSTFTSPCMVFTSEDFPLRSILISSTFIALLPWHSSHICVHSFPPTTTTTASSSSLPSFSSSSAGSLSISQTGWYTLTLPHLHLDEQLLSFHFQPLQEGCWLIVYTTFDRVLIHFFQLPFFGIEK